MPFENKHAVVDTASDVNISVGPLSEPQLAAKSLGLGDIDRKAGVAANRRVENVEPLAHLQRDRARSADAVLELELGAGAQDPEPVDEIVVECLLGRADVVIGAVDSKRQRARAAPGVSS